MKERATRVQQILNTALSEIDTKFNKEFARVLEASNTETVDVDDQRNLLAIKHTLRLQTIGEPLNDFEQQVKPNTEFRQMCDFKSLLDIANDFEREKTSCKGCPKPGFSYLKPSKKILREKLAQNEFCQYVKTLINDADE